MQKATRIAALSLVALAAVLLLTALAMGLRKPRPAAPVIVPKPLRDGGVAVVVAARDLPPGVPLAASDLRVEALAALPPGGYSGVAALIGKVPAAAIAGGTPLTSPLLARGLALALHPGERALAVPVDELAGAGNRIAPGDYVDVFLNLKERAGAPGENAGESQSRLLLSRLRVLGYGERDLDEAATPASPQDAEGRPAGSVSRGGHADARTARATARSAVLAVPVEQANRLLLGAHSGKLFLALRHPADPGYPDESLFPRPRTVLAPRAGLAEAAATPENDAFAGLDGEALAGRGMVPSAFARAAPSRSARSAPIEIIRGAGPAAPSSP